MKARLAIIIPLSFLLQACTPPYLHFYLRNYSSGPVDVVLIYHKGVPDSSSQKMTLIHGMGIERSEPFKYEDAGSMQIDSNVFKVTLPSYKTLLFPVNQRFAPDYYANTTVLLVKDHYLADTLFHNGDMKYIQKFNLLKRLFFSYQYFYDYPKH